MAQQLIVEPNLAQDLQSLNPQMQTSFTSTVYQSIDTQYQLIIITLFLAILMVEIRLSSVILVL